MAPHDCSPQSSSRALGRLGEQMAAAHLTRLGYSILARNVRTRYGEIDLIAYNGNTLAFVEVKTRRAASNSIRLDPEMAPLAGLRARQRARLRRLAAAWLNETPASRPSAQEIRFDAIGVMLDRHDRLLRLDHVEEAW